MAGTTIVEMFLKSAVSSNKMFLNIIYNLCEPREFLKGAHVSDGKAATVLCCTLVTHCFCQY